MCGPNSALGLAEHERVLWPQLRDRLRVPGALMALMRGSLGGDTEVAAVVAVTPAGIARPLALIATPAIAEEITLLDEPAASAAGVRRGRIGDDEIDVLMSRDADPPRPVAVLMTDWIREHLYLYARELWHRKRPR